MSTNTDPIADMLSRIRNAIAVNRSTVSLPHSQINESIAKTLVASGFLEAVEVIDEKPKQLQITINAEGTNSVITEINRLSTPGRRLYARADAIPKVKGGRGMIIISTSGGIMTGEQARAKQTGGELICEVY